MNPDEQHEVHAPDISNEEMKMPENVISKPESKPESTAPLNGIIIFILIFLLIFILGGLYYWFSQLMMQNDTVPQTAPAVERPTTEENNEPESANAEADVETQQALSTSDEISAIEADIEATDLDSLDAELNAIDAELEAALNE